MAANELSKPPATMNHASTVHSAVSPTSRRSSSVDALEIQRAAQAGIDTLTPERARDLLALFNGDFLEGLELDGCPELTSWLLFQRRRFRAWRVALLELAPLEVHAYA